MGPLLRGIFSVVKTAVPHGPWLVESTEAEPRMQGGIMGTEAKLYAVPRLHMFTDQLYSPSMHIRERLSSTQAHPHGHVTWHLEKKTPLF